MNLCESALYNFRGTTICIQNTSLLLCIASHNRRVALDFFLETNFKCVAIHHRTTYRVDVCDDNAVF